MIGVFKDNASLLQGTESPRLVTSIYALDRRLGARTQWMSFMITPTATPRWTRHSTTCSRRCARRGSIPWQRCGSNNSACSVTPCYAGPTCDLTPQEA